MEVLMKYLSLYTIIVLSEAIPIHTDTKKKYCGHQLSTALSKICLTFPDVPETEGPGPGEVIEECCITKCSVHELTKYCQDVDWENVRTMIEINNSIHKAVKAENSEPFNSIHKDNSTLNTHNVITKVLLKRTKDAVLGVEPNRTVNYINRNQNVH